LLKFESKLVCAPCGHGKMITASHSLVNTVMIERPGQLLHMDTVGLSRVRSMGGKWYVLVIVDNNSRYSWVFFLESKGDVFEHFRSLALRLNNEHPICLKAIRSDNGTEFRNSSFHQFCLEHGIDQQFSAPRVPRKNGVVERKNHTLVEMVMTMLNDDVGINNSDTSTPIHNQISGPITQAHARQLNNQVSSFLDSYSYYLDNGNMCSVLLLGNDGQQ
jgi:transposase InsO family protein